MRKTDFMPTEQAIPPNEDSTRAKRRAATSIVSLALVAVTLTSCTSDSSEGADASEVLRDVSIEEFADVTAELDFDTATAITPIHNYLTQTDFPTEILFTQAHEALVTTCMTEAGFAFDGLTAVDWDALRPQEDRIFGQWDRASAAIRGFDLDEDRGIPKGNPVEGGAEFNAALISCDESAKTDETLTSLAGGLMELTLADRIQGNAQTQAEESAAGRAATKRFHACLEEKSLVVDPESGYVSADYGELGREADIAAAVGEADCNIDTGRIQELYDLTARYEAAYMEEYEAQLGAVLEEKQELHRQLQDIIDSAS